MNQYILNLVRLLDPDADTHRVDARFDKDSLVFVSRDRHGRQYDLGRRPRLDLGDIVPLRRLRREVAEAQGRSEGTAYALEIWAERLRLFWDGLLERATAVGRRRLGQKGRWPSEFPWRWRD